jgi:hypothetical protein
VSSPASVVFWALSGKHVAPQHRTSTTSSQSVVLV